MKYENEMRAIWLKCENTAEAHDLMEEMLAGKGLDKLSRTQELLEFMMIKDSVEVNTEPFADKLYKLLEEQANVDFNLMKITGEAMPERQDELLKQCKKKLAKAKEMLELAKLMKMMHNATK